MKLFTLTAMFAAIGATASASADVWQYPLTNWSYYIVYYSQPYGEYNSGWNGYHLAQDTNVPHTVTGTKVYAPADGVVKWSTTPVSGYGKACKGAGSEGYVIVIEHTLQNGSKVCSTLGHVQPGPYNPGAQTGLVPVGTFVTRGQYIGRMADYWTCSYPVQNWHHMHFGIRNGAYAGNANLAGYGSYAVLQQWYEPNAFVANHAGGGSCTTNGQFVDIAKAGDANGDGKMDIYRFYGDVGRWDVMISTGSSFMSLQTWYACGHGTNSSWQSVGDMNGDGRDDAFVYFESSGRAYVALSTGSGFSGYYEATSTPMHQNMQNKFLADVDGDGRDDFIGYASGNWYVARSDGTKFQWPQWGIIGFGADTTKRIVADITGDGRADAVCVRKSDGSWWAAGGQPNCTFGTGYGLWALGHGSTADDWDLVDVDGNHAEDAASFWHYFNPWPGAVIVWNSYGLGTGGFHQDNNFRTCGQSGGSTKRIFADFNGDGREDYAFYYTSTGWNVAISDGYSFWPASRW